jgi:hypothetical protein
MLRISVSDLQCYQRYRDQEEVTLEECLSQMRRERPPTPAMLAGSALHAALEHSEYDSETLTVESDGFRFFFDCEIDLEVPAVRELKGEMEISTAAGLVTLVGVVDAIDGAIYDYKLTGRFDAERLAESWQWRCYLHMFSCSKFIYRVFVGTCRESEPYDWTIREYHELPLYRYSGMDDQILKEVEECALFMREHLYRRAA